MKHQGTVLRIHLPGGGLGEAEKESVLRSLAGKLPGKHLAELEKALKVGGPAHAGLSPQEVVARQEVARAKAEALSSGFKKRLIVVKDSWVSAVALRDAATSSIGRVAADEHLRSVRRTIVRSARQSMRYAYRRMWKLGKEAGGNLKPLTHDEKLEVDKLQRNEWQFFANLLEDVDNKTFRMNLDQRIGLYGRALFEAFSAGFVMADLSPERYLRWSRTASESCADCVKLSSGGRWGQGVYQALEVAKAGIFPRGSHLLCGSNCKCSWVEVERPKGKASAQGELLGKIVLHGRNKQGQSFTGLGRENRERFGQRAAKNTWGWGGRKRAKPKA